MSPAWWVAVGAGGYMLVSVLIGCATDRDIREGILRVFGAVVLVPALLVTAVGVRLPKAGRRVSPESLIEVLQGRRFRLRTVVAINWPRGALVWMRVKPLEDR